MVSGMTSAAGGTVRKACPAASTWIGGICLAPARLRLLIQLSGPSPTASHGSAGLTMPQIQSCTDPEMPRMSAFAELVDAITVPAAPSSTVTVTTSIDAAVRQPRSTVVTRVPRVGAVAIPHTSGAGFIGRAPGCPVVHGGEEWRYSCRVPRVNCGDEVGVQGSGLPGPRTGGGVEPHIRVRPRRLEPHPRHPASPVRHRTHLDVLQGHRRRVDRAQEDTRIRVAERGFLGPVAADPAAPAHRVPSLLREAGPVPQVQIPPGKAVRDLHPGRRSGGARAN